MTERLPYRLLYNQDNSALFMQLTDRNLPARPEHIDQMVDEVADGGVDAILICPAAQKAVFPSRVWERAWQKAEVLETDMGKRFIAKAKEMADRCNYLERALCRCREKGVAPGVSIRMNDMHGVGWPEVFSTFYKEHPEWHLPDIPARTWGARGLDYRVPEVRRHMMDLIEEVVTDYDLDLLELDFLRFQAYFPRENVRENAEIMTNFLAEARKVLHDHRPGAALLARVGSTPSGVLGLGFDLSEWARRKLVDGVTVAQYLNTGWEIPISDFRQILGDDVAIYAGGEVCAYAWPGGEKRLLPIETELMRGFAAGYLAAGADGLNLFNFFCTREEGFGRREPNFNALAEMKSLDFLRNQTRTHVITSGFTLPETDLPVQTPVNLAAGESRRFRITLARSNRPMRTQFRVILAEKPEKDGIWMYCNEHPLSMPGRIEKDQPEDKFCQVTFQVPPEIIRDGLNQLVLRAEIQPAEVLGIQCRFAPENGSK